MTSKEEASAPTVATKSVMPSATIYAMGERYVTIVEIPGAFIQADIDEVVNIKFEGKIAEMLVRMDLKIYRKYVKDENGKAVLYVELLKALNDTLKAALLFWKLLSRKLVLWGFEINHYDWCISNKMIEGKPCTIMWHVDDLKISHVNDNVNTNIIKMINSEFGEEAPLTITRGEIHDCLGMTLDYSEKGTVKIKMLDYVEKMLADLPDEMDVEAPSPAANHLFIVDDKQTKVDEKRASSSTYMYQRHCYGANGQDMNCKRLSLCYMREIFLLEYSILNIRVQPPLLPYVKKNILSYFFINNTKINNIEKNRNIIDYLENLNIKIPHYCYHLKLLISGIKKLPQTFSILCYVYN
jgi:hypothetical protein